MRRAPSSSRCAFEFALLLEQDETAIAGGTRSIVLGDEARERQRQTEAFVNAWLQGYGDAYIDEPVRQ